MYRRIHSIVLNWIYSVLFVHIERTVVSVLKAGPIPRHVAFVMDGNRRYARSIGAHVFQGHVNGFFALRRVLEIMFLLGVQCVSVYAFAIDNFKREPEEVNALMKLAEERLIEFCEHDGVLKKHGVRLVVLGRTELLPPAVQAAVRKAEDLTKDNTRAVFNLCFAYSSRDEMASAVTQAVNDKLNEPSPTPITLADLESHMMTAKANSPPLDIFVRTSGVSRLSDFMLWQCSDNTQIQIIKRYWPEIGLLDLIPVVLDYQRKIWWA